MENLTVWLNKAAPWLGFILMAVAGGIVNYVREFEQYAYHRTTSQHAWAVFRLGIMSGFSGLLIYQAAAALDITGSPWSYFWAGFCGMFASKFFDLIWFLGIKLLSAKLDIKLGDPFIAPKRKHEAYPPEEDR